MEGLVYLTNEHNEASAGWYDPRVADVLLRESQGWHVSDPATGEPTEVLAPAEAAATDAGGSGAQTPGTTPGEHDPLNLTPPDQLSDGGNAGDPKE